MVLIVYYSDKAGRSIPVHGPLTAVASEVLEIPSLLPVALTNLTSDETNLPVPRV